MNKSHRMVMLLSLLSGSGMCGGSGRPDFDDLGEWEASPKPKLPSLAHPPSPPMARHQKRLSPADAERKKRRRAQRLARRR
jgi:hypothetical protein